MFGVVNILELTREDGTILRSSILGHGLGQTVAFIPLTPICTYGVSRQLYTINVN